MSRLLIILPTYNECENLPRIASALLSLLPEAHLLVVDDSSPDGTGNIADELARHENRLYVLHRPRKEGLGRAYISGFQWGLAHEYTHFAQMDVDGSHRPQDLLNLLPILDKADVVIGSRFIPGGRIERWPLWRHLLSLAGGLYIRTILHLSIGDVTSGFKCLRRSALEGLHLSEISAVGYCFQCEMNYHWASLNLLVVEVPIVFMPRVAGRSKISTAVISEALCSPWRLRRQSPLKRTTWCNTLNWVLPLVLNSITLPSKNLLCSMVNRKTIMSPQLQSRYFGLRHFNLYISLTLLSTIFLIAAFAKMQRFSELQATIVASRLVPDLLTLAVARLVIGAELVVATFIWLPSWRVATLCVLSLLASVFASYSA